MVTEFEDIKDGLLLRINKLAPLMCRFSATEATMRLGFQGFSEEDIFEESEWNGYGLFAYRMEKARETETEGLRKGYRIVEEADFLPDLTGKDDIVEYFVAEVEKNKMADNDPSSAIFNFALGRVIDTIRRFPEPPRIYYKDYEWEEIETPDGNITVPGFTKTILGSIERETQAILALNDITEGLWNNTLDTTKVYCCFELDFQKPDNSNSLKGQAFYRYVFERIETYVETFLPGCVTSFISKRGDNYTGRIYSGDVLFLYVGYNDFKKGWFAARLINDEQEFNFRTCLYYLCRMLHNIEEKKSTGKPGFTWDSKKNIQMSIPPDAKCVSNISGMKILVSRETETLIQIAEEEDPHIRIMVYPFQFFKDIKTKSNPLLNLK